MYISDQITIAQICGWTGINYDQHGNPRGSKPQVAGWPVSAPIHLLPDYLNDQNAMYEAEETLRDYKIGVYQQCVKDLVGPNRTGGLFPLMHIPAALRAKAFLKAHGR